MVYFLSFDNDLPAFIGRLHTGENLDQRGLPGTVFPHKGMHLSRINIELDLIQGFHSRESLADIRNF